jgi:hypothetical protein
MPSPDPARPAFQPDAWVRIKRVFEAVVDLPPAAREALIAQATLPADEQAELLSLLARHDAAATHEPLLDRPATLAAEVPAAGQVGERLGSWAIVRALGRGGMGEVYEVRRADGQYEGRAAAKLLRGGLGGPALLARFALERQALARLSHPHIARLLDAGLADGERPYFVMEAVEGRPIDEAARDLPVPRRVDLLLQLADAVAHAHAQLLVHRDLKPGNVLVDAEGRVKLLDFGIAKALQAEVAAGDAGQPAAQVAGSSVGTRAGPRPFTPHYASPEQVRGEPVGVATDIYSLGVLLYELLTGSRPTGHGATTPDEAARCVLEQAPQRPSEAVRDAAPALVSQLQGDLDAIVLKALAKDPPERYASVEALAADLRAWREHRPVKARPATPLYLAACAWRRHRLPIAAAALGLAGLLVGLVVALVQMRQSEAALALAERRLQQVRQLAGKLVFEHHDRIGALAGALEARGALLADGAAVMDALLAEGPADATLAREAAETYFRIATLQGERLSPNQGRWAEAERNLDKALALQPAYVDAAAPDDALRLPRAADMWLAKASQLQARVRLQDAEAALQRAQGLVERALVARPGDAEAISRQASVHGRLAEVLGDSHASANLGRLADARPHAERAVALLQAQRAREPANPRWPHELAWAVNKQYRIALLQGRGDDALAASRLTVELADAAAAVRPEQVHLRYQTGVVRMAVARALSALGRHDESLAQQAQALTLFDELAAADPGNRAAAFYQSMGAMSRGEALVRAGREAEARAALAPLLAQLQGPSPPDYPTRRLQAEMAVWAARAWRPHDAAAALRHAEQAEARLGEQGGADNEAWRWTRAMALGEQAAALAALQRPVPARERAQAALQAWGDAAPALFAPQRERDRLLAEGR